MIRLGLCSGACISRDIAGVIAMARAARLDGVEWAADAHIGVDELPAAASAMMATLRAGLTTTSYSTLYRAGAEDPGFFRFDALLRVAAALHAPKMRIYAHEGRQAADALASQLGRLGDRAAMRGITLCVSMCRGSGLDRYDNAARLAASAGHDFVRLAWEDLPGAKAGEEAEALVAAGRFAALAVARGAARDGSPLPIAGSEAAWRARIQAFRRSDPCTQRNMFVLLATARPDGGGGDAALARDAEALRALLADGVGG